MDGITIRPAEEGDLTRLLALFADYHNDLRAFGMPYTLRPEGLQEVLAARLHSKMFRFLVCCKDGAVCGFLIASVLRISREYACGDSAFMGYINELYVQPALRGCRLADRMMDEAEAWLRERGATMVEYCCLAGNESARRMCARRDYRTVAETLGKNL